MRVDDLARRVLVVSVLFVSACQVDDDELASTSSDVTVSRDHWILYDAEVTNYTLVREADTSGQHTGDATMLCPPTLGGACYHREFLCSAWGVAMQGTGIGNDG